MSAVSNDLEIDDALGFADWAIQTQIWNGRQVSWNEASEFCQEVKSRILETLFQEPSDSEFERMAAQYAWIGRDDATRALLAKDIQALDFSKQDWIVQAGLRKSTAQFWKKHKKEILIGLAIVAVITVVVVVAVSSAGTAAGGAVAAGGAALDELTKSDSKPPSVSNKIPRVNAPPDAIPETPPLYANPQISSTTPSIALDRSPVVESFISENKSLPDPYLNRPFTKSSTPWEASGLRDNLVFSEKGIHCNGSFSSYDEVLGHKLTAPYSSNDEAGRPLFAASSTVPPSIDGNFPTSPPISGERTWIGDVLDAIGQSMIEPELMDPESSLIIPETSCRLSTIGDRSPPHLRISGINGMNNSMDEAVSNMEYLSSFVPNKSIDWVYNRSHGPVIDFLEILMNYRGYSPNTEQLLSENWTAFHEGNKDRPHAKYLQICHSQGAIHVRNTLAKLPEEIRNRIIVIAVAPGAVVPDEECFKSFNYACKGDIVPNGELIFTRAFDPNECGISKSLERALDYHDQIIWLEPDPDMNKDVHSFQHEVYKESIQFRINEYLNNNGEYQ